MTSRPDTPDVADTAGSPDWGQLALVLLAVLALVVAAFAAPPLLDRGGGGSGSPGDGGGGGGGLQPQDGGDSGSGGSGGSGGAGTDGSASGDGDRPGGGGGFEIREPENFTIQPPGDPPYDEDELREALEDGCWVVAHSRPVPGRELTVSVWADRGPREGSRVWFNEVLVGTTGEDGRVTGEVPYEAEFEVRAAVPDADGCRFVTPVPQGQRRSAVDATQEFGSTGVAGASASLPGTSGASRAQSGTETPNGTASDGGETVSRTYTFRGNITVRVAGAAYPGGEVTVTSALGGNPVENGRVSLDGREVGRTDSDGRYRLAVPDDAAGRLRIQVRRGDFSGSSVVRIHDIQLSLVPAKPLPLPGQQAVARVTLVGQPVPDAPVTLDGDRLGRTDANGTVRFVIPTDPGARLETSGLGLQASTPVWPLFVPTLAVVLGTLAIGAVTTRRRWQREGPAAGKRLAAAWAGVLAILAGYVVAGASGALVASLGVALVLLVVLVRTRGGVAVETAGTLRERLRALVRRLRHTILQGVDAIAAGVDWLRATTGRILAWLADQPHSIAALLARLGAWLRALPGHVGQRVTGLVVAVVTGVRETGFRALRSGYSHQRLALLVLAALFLGAAYWEWEAQGALALGILYALVVVARLLRRSGTAGPEAAEEPSPVAGDTTGSPTSGGSGPIEVSLRDLWRRFARRVAPGNWQTRTPVEVAQLAVDRGLPAGPVERLTRAFREIEYGDRTLTPDEDSAARAAYETLRETLAGEREVDEQ